MFNDTLFTFSGTSLTKKIRVVLDSNETGPRASAKLAANYWKVIKAGTHSGQLVVSRKGTDYQPSIYNLTVAGLRERVLVIKLPCLQSCFRREMLPYGGCVRSVCSF